MCIFKEVRAFAIFIFHMIRDAFSKTSISLFETKITSENWNFKLDFDIPCLIRRIFNNPVFFYDDLMEWFEYNHLWVTVNVVIHEFSEISHCFIRLYGLNDPHGSLVPPNLLTRAMGPKKDQIESPNLLY